MKKIITLFLGLAFLSSCTMSHTISCTNNPVGNKTEVSKTKLFGNQDISYASACKKGNISKVGTTEIKMTNSYCFYKLKSP